MSKTWAVFTIALAFGVGLFGARAYLSMSAPYIAGAITCELLSEAQKTGLLDAQKTNAVLDRIRANSSLSGESRQLATELRTVCPRLSGVKL